MKKQKRDKKNKPNKRPSVSFRVEPQLKEKILKVYGGYQPLEKIIEKHMLNITPPSTKHTNNKRVRDIQLMIKEYKELYTDIEKNIKTLTKKQKNINDKIIKLQKEIETIKEINNQIS